MNQPLTMAEAEKLIQRIALLAMGVGFRSHCLEQMEKRGFDALDIIRILRHAGWSARPTSATANGDTKSRNSLGMPR
jgi:hypothetical protein